MPGIIAGRVAGRRRGGENIAGMDLTSITSTRLAAALSLIALSFISVSDFLLTNFWDRNAMVTSVVADILVLIVGVAVVNEFLAARSRRRWRRVADYSLTELSSSCRNVWVNLAEAIGVGHRDEVSREELRALVQSPPDRDRGLDELAHRFAADRDAPKRLKPVIEGVARTTRAVLTSWAPVLIETPYSGALSRYVELQMLLGALDIVLFEEVEGKRASYEGTGDPEWLASRLVSLIRLGSQLELDFHSQAATAEIRAPGQR
jgi:hypothetical protein